MLYIWIRNTILNGKRIEKSIEEEKCYFVLLTFIFIFGFVFFFFFLVLVLLLFWFSLSSATKISFWGYFDGFFVTPFVCLTSFLLQWVSCCFVIFFIFIFLKKILQRRKIDWLIWKNSSATRFTWNKFKFNFSVGLSMSSYYYFFVVLLKVRELPTVFHFVTMWISNSFVSIVSM